MPSFAPGGDGTLVTTTANVAQSKALCKLIQTAVQGHAARWFDQYPHFVDKSFEIVTDLCGYYAPAGNVVTFINLRGLFGLDMKPAQRSVSPSEPSWRASATQRRTFIRAG